MDVILALDGGATRTRCVAIDLSGRPLAEAEDGPSNHLQESEKTVHDRLADLTERTLALANLRENDVRCLSAGLAGVDYDGYGAEPMTALFHRLGFKSCLVFGDLVIAHAAALAMEPGIVILAGTGSAVLGIDASGRRVKAGGWGPVYGDEGSARGISEQALTAAARAYDGRGPSTALLEAITAALRIADFRDSISVIYGAQPRDIASLCPVIYRTAVAGDSVARSLFDTAAGMLVEGAMAAARQLGLDRSPVRVSYQGGVAEHCPLLVERMTEKLQTQLPLARLQPPLWPPVMGAYLLACRSLNCQAGLNECSKTTSIS